MNGWIIAEWVAWAISAYLLLWILLDAIRVSREHDEDFLLSSREGYDELVDENQTAGSNGASGT
ncbi:MAG: hypothetical protein BMS9Abin01_1803 [Gammaproteobacteria bacterium]|nr:MAG: hypothetical protein BMS9Abin01_1803 [Gammaproteobacteria bacterium]